VTAFFLALPIVALGTCLYARLCYRSPCLKDAPSCRSAADCSPVSSFRPLDAAAETSDVSYGSLVWSLLELAVWPYAVLWAMFVQEPFDFIYEYLAERNLVKPTPPPAVTPSAGPYGSFSWEAAATTHQNTTSVVAAKERLSAACDWPSRTDATETQALIGFEVTPAGYSAGQTPSNSSRDPEPCRMPVDEPGSGTPSRLVLAPVENAVDVCGRAVSNDVLGPRTPAFRRCRRRGHRNPNRLQSWRRHPQHSDPRRWRPQARDFQGLLDTHASVANEWFRAHLAFVRARPSPTVVS
jgi:hypothetical protein